MVDANGLRQLDVTKDVIPTHLYGGDNFEFSDGYIFEDSGELVDATSKTVLGTFNLETDTYNNPAIEVVPEVTASRVYFLPPNYKIKAFDLNTFAPVGETDLSLEADYSGI